jgi:hypothetical protein
MALQEGEMWSSINPLLNKRTWQWCNEGHSYLKLRKAQLSLSSLFNDLCDTRETITSLSWTSSVHILLLASQNSYIQWYSIWGSSILLAEKSYENLRCQSQETSERLRGRKSMNRWLWGPNTTSRHWGGTGLIPCLGSTFLLLSITIQSLSTYAVHLFVDLHLYKSISLIHFVIFFPI